MKDIYTIHTDDGITTIHLFDKMNLSQIRGLFEELQESNPSPLRIWDINSSKVLFTDQQIKTIAAFRSSLPIQPSKVAIVAPTDYDYGIASVFEIYREQKQIALKVFREHAKAKQWLHQNK